MASMAFDIIDRLVIVVYGRSAPTSGDWDAFLRFVRDTGIDRTTHLVYSDGGRPSAAQSAQLSDLIDGREVPRAILTDSPRIRVAARIAGLLARRIRAFSPSGLRDALAYLEVPASRIEVIGPKLDELRAAVA
jgi:hypothetical protein